MSVQTEPDQRQLAVDERVKRQNPLQRLIVRPEIGALVGWDSGWPS